MYATVKWDVDRTMIKIESFYPNGRKLSLRRTLHLYKSSDQLSLGYLRMKLPRTSRVTSPLVRHLQEQNGLYHNHMARVLGCRMDGLKLGPYATAECNLREHEMSPIKDTIRRKVVPSAPPVTSAAWWVPSTH